MVRITNANDILTNDATFLIYSPPGIGKTSTIKFLPGKTLVLDVDRTSRVLKGYENIDIAYVDNQNTWKEWGNLVKELSELDLSKYDNVVLDNISELERCMLANLGREGKNNRVPGIQNYQQVQFFLIDSIRFLKTLGKNIIITAWETTDLWTTEDGQQFNRAYPQISAKILTNFMGLCDVVGRLVYNAKTENRGFYLQPNNSVFAKNQLDNRKFCLQEELMNIGDVDVQTS
jgi:phage nucleotide-binding protein